MKDNRCMAEESRRIALLRTFICSFMSGLPYVFRELTGSMGAESIVGFDGCTESRRNAA